MDSICFRRTQHLQNLLQSRFAEHNINLQLQLIAANTKMWLYLETFNKFQTYLCNYLFSDLNIFSLDLTENYGQRVI